MQVLIISIKNREPLHTSLRQCQKLCNVFQLLLMIKKLNIQNDLSRSEAKSSIQSEDYLIFGDYRF